MAIQYYDKALSIDPNDKYAVYSKGNALSSLGNYTQAIQSFDKALAIGPFYTDNVSNLKMFIILYATYRNRRHFFRYN